jgi:hypothetical protein
MKSPTYVQREQRAPSMRYSDEQSSHYFQKGSHMKTLTQSLVALLTLSLLAACGGPATPNLVTPDGTNIEGDKGISGAVTGVNLGSNSKIAIFGAFTNVSGNKIDTQNKTIEADTTLAYSAVSGGKYGFRLPKAPQKAQAAVFNVFAFNDSNNNNAWDDGELKSKEAKITWNLVTGYTLAIDADGNPVAALTSDFKDFDFKLN